MIDDVEYFMEEGYTHQTGDVRAKNVSSGQVRGSSEMGRHTPHLSACQMGCVTPILRRGVTPPIWQALRRGFYPRGEEGGATPHQ